MPQPVAYLPDGSPLSDEKLHAAISTGDARFKTGEPVHFIDNDGNRFSVPGELAWQEIKSGSRLLTSSEAEHAKQVKEAGRSGAEAAKTVGTGIARTLTFGLSDPLLESVSPGYAQNEQIRQEANPGIKQASELAGYALPIAGELGLGGRVVKAATAAPRALSAVARGAGEAATAGLAEGAGKRVLGGVVAGGIEGAGFGVQQGISEQTVNNEPLTWQRIAMNSALGAGLGGLLGGLSPFGRKAEKALPAREIEGKPSLLEPAPVAEVNPSGKPPLAEGIIDRAQRKVADASVGMEMRGAGYRGSDIAAFTREGGPETVERYARRLKNEAGIRTGIGGDSIKDIYSKQLAQKADAGAQFNAISNQLEDAGFRVDAQKALADIDETVLKPLRESSVADTRRLANRVDDGILSDLRKQVAGDSPEFSAAQKQRVAELVRDEYKELYEEAKLKFMDENPVDRPAHWAHKLSRDIQSQLRARQSEFADIARKELQEQGLGVPKTAFTFDEWRAIRGEIDKKIDLSKARGELTEKGKVVRSIRDQMEKSLNSQVRESVPGPLADAYSAAKLRYKDWTQMSDALKHRMGITEGNRFISLTDTIAAAEGATALGAPGAILGALLNKTIRSPQASRIGAEIANKVAGKHAVLGASELTREAAEAAGKMAQHVNETVRGSSFSLPALTKAAAYQVKIATSKGAANLLEFAQHVQTARDQIGVGSTALAGLDGVPGVQREAAMTQANGLQLVADLAPHADQPLNPVLGDNQPPPPESLAHEYADIVRVLDRPSRVLDNFKDGTLTRKQVGVIQQLLPDVTADFQKAAMTAMSDQIKAGKTPAYQMRLRMGMLTGVPIDPSDTPEFTATIQSVYNQMPMAPQQPAKRSRGSRQPRGSEMSSRRKSTLERIEES